MAWLQDLAIKTETFLDKIDKSANNLFHESEIDSGRCSTSSQLNEENQEIDSLNINSKDDSEMNFEWYQNELDQLKSNYENKISEFESYNNELREQLLRLQHNFAEVNNENEILKNQIQHANDCVLIVENEMNDYKNKVQNVLTKNQQSAIGEEISENENKIKDLQQKINYFEEVNNILTLQVQTLTQNFNNLQNEYNNLQNSNSKDLKNLQINFENERNMRISIDDENREKSLEIRSLTLELNDQIKKFDDKQKECEMLREAMNKSEENVDLTLRVQSLTETLISKQNTLETLTTERTVLKLQLEKVRSEYLRMMEEASKENNNPKIDENVKLIESLNSKSINRSKLIQYSIFIYLFILHICFFIILYCCIPK